MSKVLIAKLLTPHKVGMTSTKTEIKFIHQTPHAFSYTTEVQANIHGSYILVISLHSFLCLVHKYFTQMLPPQECQEGEVFLLNELHELI